MLRFSTMITGDDYRMLRKDTPKSRKKVNALASSVFIPVLMWGINAFLLLHKVFEENLHVSLLTAMICALLIFLVERSIVMSKGIWAMVFRIFLGLVIASIGAISLDEVIFAKDIDQQMELNKLTLIGEKQLEKEKEYIPRIEKLEEDVKNKNAVWLDALKSAEKEADGTGGSGVRGIHGITKLKLQIATEKEEHYHSAKTALAQLLIKMETEKAGIKAELENSYDSHALLNRIKAMFDLVLQDRYVMIAYVLFFLLVFFMEFMVVITKMTWGETNYERNLEMIEELGKKRMDILMHGDSLRYKPESGYQGYRNGKNLLKNINANNFLL